MDRNDENEAVRTAWNQNASFWDERMGEGNQFVKVLVWPQTERLLDLTEGERVLDIACGNGLTSRKMAAKGAAVLGVDFSESMIEQARNRPNPDPGQVEYLVADATSYASLVELGEASFDAVLCNMALFDMAEIEPLMRAVPKLLKGGGRFVFSVIHPCFNNLDCVQMAEMENRDRDIVTTYSVKVRGYMTPTVKTGVAIPGQPVAHPFFHRPLSKLFGAAFDAGLVVDALEEGAFPAGDGSDSESLSWGGNYSEIPAVLIARLRIR